MSRRARPWYAALVTLLTTTIIVFEGVPVRAYLLVIGAALVVALIAAATADTPTCRHGGDRGGAL